MTDLQPQPTPFAGAPSAPAAANPALAHQLVESLPDGLLVIDADGIVRFANPAMLRLLARPALPEVVGHDLRRLLAPASHAAGLALLSWALTNAAPATRVELALTQPDQRSLPAEVSASRLEWDGRPAVCMVVRASPHGQEAGPAVTALVRLAARLNATLDRDAVLSAICEETAAALGQPVVIVSLYDKQRDAFIPVADHGLPPRLRERLQQLPTAVSNPAERDCPLMVIPDLRAVEPSPDLLALLALDLHSLASVSLLRDGQSLAAIHVAGDAPPRDDELALLRGIAHQAAQALAAARLARQARRRAAYLQAHRAIEMATSSSLDLRLTLEVMLTQIIAHLRVDAVDLLLHNSSTGILEYAGGRGFRSSGIRRFRLRPGEGYAGRAALERRLISIPRLERAERRFGRGQAQLLAGENFVAYFAAPLIAKGQVTGVLEIFHRSRLDPDAEWLHFVEALATQAAIAIDNATLFNDLQRSNAQLTMAYDATIEGWSRALELRDEETQGHTLRVADLTVSLARGMGAGKDELPHIRRGALLHDIGKMAIPDHILGKRGPLTDDEWEIMRRHPVYAYEMLSPVAFLRPALDIPYCHHEKWDGSGYPRGLKGTQIPLSARIFAVADIWDALRSDRPYRAGWGEARVLDYLRSLAGSHLDPQAVAAFLALMSQDSPVIGVTETLRSI